MYTYLLSISAVLVGYIIVLFFKPDNTNNLKLLLAFSGAFLLAITVFNLLPEVFEDHEHSKKVGVWIMIGILLQKILEYFSQGAEHGHIQVDKKTTKIPKLLFFSLGLHALLEGFPLHHSKGILAGIIVHKIPIAMILSTFLKQTNIKKPIVIFLLILFAFMTPFGTFIAENFESIQKYYAEITALVIGIFLHVSTTILFENSQGHAINITKLMIVLVATAIAYFI